GRHKAYALQMAVHAFVSWAGPVAEVAGILTMLVGAVIALLLAAHALWRQSPSDAFRGLRHNLGKAILLGLEFLIAADIIRTVSEHPTFNSVAVLGAVVLIRTFLSFALEVELEGRWPWQRGPEDKAL